MKIFGIILLLFLTACNNGVEFGVREQSQNFAQDIKYNRKVDILFVIDNSQSMNLVQQQLINQIPYMFDSLQSLNMDVHIASTSTTMNSHFENRGRLIGTPKFISSETPNFLEELKKRIFIGEDGSTIEEGLSSMETVRGAWSRAPEGKGFLREESFLNIIVLSNEDDSSPEAWNYYAAFLDKLRPNNADGTKSWAMHFSGVLSMADSCSSSDWGYKYPGYRYMQLADFSGGTKGSLCGTDLYKSVSSFKARMIQILTDYKLDRKPNLDTIKVFVNGFPVAKDEANGWSYIVANNLVRFNGTAVPKADDGIRVDFTPIESE